ncbi:MAG: hydrogenase maturation protease [Deltaproteobacteria bacterium]|nr:hydrogenase maturation protease [Deltaproteobacteria bacterium]MBI4796137.1 hydrogenase maturation protease [Deltaproteobacteria bacterium]
MVRELFEKSTLVFGCGNILFGDDGFGPAVVKYLQDNYPLPADVLVLDVGTSIRDLLFDLVLIENKPQKIVIIDAVDHPDRRPGEIFEIPVEAIPPKKTADFSLHQFPTVNMLQELKEHTQVEIHVVVAQVQEIPEEVRPGLSPAVAGAIKDAAAQILHILRFAN